MLLQRGSELVAEGRTDGDGRIRSLGGELPAGAYRLTFEAGEYLAARDHLFDRVSLEFQLPEGAGHHHIPLLLTPFAVSSYRGS